MRNLGGGVCPRKRRRESSTGIYHVIARGINRENIFNQAREKIYFRNIIRKAVGKFGVEIYCYCIMSNHIHLVIKSEITELSSFMAKILAEYAEYYNYKHNRNGHVFQNRFQSECIESEKYFWNCLRYIHMNPVKAGIVKSMMRYKYSSIHEYKMGKIDILHEKAPKLLCEKFGKWDEFLDFHGNGQRQIFLDTKEEVYFQQKEVAIHILQLMQYENEVSEMREILENKKLRAEYQDKIREEFKISNKRMLKIYEDIRQTIM